MKIISSFSLKVFTCNKKMNVLDTSEALFHCKKENEQLSNAASLRCKFCS